MTEKKRRTTVGRKQSAQRAEGPEPDEESNLADHVKPGLQRAAMSKADQGGGSKTGQGAQVKKSK